MIQFINALHVNVETARRTGNLDDAVDSILIPIHRIVSVYEISYHELCKLVGIRPDPDDDAQLMFWTVVHWDGTEHQDTAYIRHEMDRVMRAIAFLNTDQTRTTCYVDDPSERNMG